MAIGALSTYTEIRNSALLARRYPMLGLAASETGGLATQNRGTVGGNIANASPAADTPPALLVYDAELELVSSAGTRRVPYRSFHRGYKTMDLAPGELITRIHLPPVTFRLKAEATSWVREKAEEMEPGATTIGRSGRAARRRSRKSASPGRSA